MDFNIFNSLTTPEILGLIGSFCFAVYAWPQAYFCIRNKTTKGITWSFVLGWLSAAVLSSIYAAYHEQHALLPNYICGGLGVSCLIVLKFIYPDKKRV